RGVCVGSAFCAGTAPGVFRLDATRRARPLDPDTDASEDVLAAAEGCPVEAITITLRETGETVFPPED
ncbi:ferredoxin, partial [Streptomyces sp. GC420]|uniref:ferredoxin n=1 Tax=Streptomyces sp. GC420 TaxID=2697568 RepID=UPI001414F949